MRRAALIVVSIAVPLVLLTVCASLPHKEEGQTSAHQAETKEASQAPGTTTGNHADPKRQPQATQQEPPNWYASLWACLAADVTPQWALVIIAVLGAWVAWNAFVEDRDAIRLTQRADVMLERIRIRELGEPRRLGPKSRIIFLFKNFGPTRANEVVIHVVWTVVPDEGERQPNQPKAPIAVGGGETCRMRFPPLGTAYRPILIENIASGKSSMTFRATISYRDVFGNHHGDAWLGEFDPRTQSFNVEQSQEGQPRQQQNKP